MIYHNYSPYFYSSLNHYPNKVTPYPYSSRLPRISKSHSYNNTINANNSYKHNHNAKNDSIQTTNHNIKIPPSHKKKPSYEEDCIDLKEDNILFEIFGIKLYFDDILLICLIFFLYTEGVEDQYLFIALILLLLS